MAPEDRRQQLVEIGARLFAERPFSDVWIEQVAEEAGVSRGLIYHYFPNKRDFFAAIVRHGIADAMRLTEPDPALPPIAQLRASIDSLLSYIEANENAVRAVHRGQHSVDEEIVAAIRQARDAQAARIAKVLQPDREASAALLLALYGWMHMVDAVILEWLDAHTIARETLVDLLAGSLAGVVAAVLEAAPGALDPAAIARAAAGVVPSPA